MIGSSRSSSSSSSTQSQTSLRALEDEPGFMLTLFDMDDTLVRMKEDPLHGLKADSIKNAHLLLPILLFISSSRHHDFGICTNRAPNESEGCYPVSAFIKTLASFGIVIPSDHIIIAGGENNRDAVETQHELDQAMSVLNKHLEALRFTQVGTEATDTLVLLKKQLESRFHGKNFHILKFLEERLDRQDSHFVIQGKAHAKDSFICGIVDDRASIADEVVMKPLGLEHFFGVKATDGGNPPKHEDVRGDYYEDKYLIVLAKKIGLHELSQDLTQSMPPMMLMAATLYAWQALKDKTSLSMLERCFERLNTTQMNQIILMLQEIITAPNLHPDAQYNAVDLLLPLAQDHWNLRFLEEAPRRLAEINYQIDMQEAQSKLKTLSLSTSELESDFQKVEQEAEKSSKKGFLFSLKRSKSARSSADEEPPLPQVNKLQEALEHEKQEIRARINALCRHKNKDISIKAQKVLESLSSNSWQVSSPAILLSRSSSSASRPERKLSRRSRSTRIQPPLYVSQTSSTSEEAPIDVKKKSKRRTKRDPNQ